MKLIRFVALTLLFALSLFPAAEKKVEAGQILDKAFYFYYNSDYENAVQYFERYIEIAGEKEVPLRYLGRLHLIAEKFEKAIEYLKRAIKADPKSIPAYELLAQAYLKANEPKEAVKALEKILRIDQFNLNALATLAYLHRSQKEMRKAAVYYKRIVLVTTATGSRPDILAQAYSSLGNYYYSLGDYRRAIDYYLKYKDLNPENTRTLLVLGELYKMIGEFHQSVAVLTELLQQKPDYDPAIESLIESLYILRDYRTRGYLVRFLAKRKKIAPLHSGMLYEMQDEDKKAVQSFQKTLENNPNRLAAHIGLARSYKKLKDNDGLRKETFTSILLARKLGAGDVALVHLGILYDVLGQQAKEIQFQKRFFQNNDEGALLLGTDVERLAKDYVEVYSTHASVLESMNKLRGAAAYYRLDILYIDRLIKWYKAQQHDLEALKKNPKEEKEDENASSGESFEKGLKFLSDKEKNLQKKIRGARFKRYGEYINLAWVLRSKALGETDKALEVIQKAKKSFPEVPQAYAVEGIVAYSLGDNDSSWFKKGEASMRKAIELQKASKRKVPASYYFYHALHLEKLKKFDEMENAMIEAIKLDPYNSQYLNYLGYMYSLRNVKLAQAEDLLLRALEDEPENQAYLDSYGWILFKQGKVQQAIRQLVQARNIAEKKNAPDAVIYYHIAEAYYKLKEFSRAQFYYEKVLNFKGEIFEDLPMAEIRARVKKISSRKNQNKE